MSVLLENDQDQAKHLSLTGHLSNGTLTILAGSKNQTMGGSLSCAIGGISNLITYSTKKSYLLPTTSVALTTPPIVYLASLTLTVDFSFWNHTENYLSGSAITGRRSVVLVLFSLVNLALVRLIYISVACY